MPSRLSGLRIPCRVAVQIGVLVQNRSPIAPSEWFPCSLQDARVQMQYRPKRMDRGRPTLNPVKARVAARSDRPPLGAAAACARAGGQRVGRYPDDRARSAGRRAAPPNPPSEHPTGACLPVRSPNRAVGSPSRVGRTSAHRAAPPRNRRRPAPEPRPAQRTENLPGLGTVGQLVRQNQCRSGRPIPTSARTRARAGGARERGQAAVASQTPTLRAGRNPAGSGRRRRDP